MKARRIIGVLLVGLLLGCKESSKEAAPTLSPVFSPRPVVTVTQFGSFELARPVDIAIGASLHLPWVQLPDWLELGEDEESWFLSRVHEAYMPLANPSGELADGVFRDHHANVISTTDDFLERYPGSDGVIPVLMMLGNVHSYQVWRGGRSPELLGQEYEQAIELLLERHPERLPHILNDLIDMGLPIDWVQSTDLGIEGGETLLFTYQFSPPAGEPKGQMYALVKEPNSPWVFAPVPTRYADGWQHSIGRTPTIADINADGQTEVVVHLHHVYAGGPGLCVQVFTWDDGTWTNRMSWNPLGRTLYGNSPPPDAYYGGSWIEDLDEDGIQEIVVDYYTASPGGGNPPTVDVYQWDQASRTYTDTLPIKVRVCGYHAFAEAERRRALGDLEGAIPWYEEARRRWLAESGTPDSACFRYPPAEHIAQSYRIQVAVQQQVSNTSSGGWGIYVRYLNDGYQVEAGEDVLIETTTLTGTLRTEQVQVSLFQCEVEPCRVVGRVYPFAAYVQDWVTGNRVICSTGDASHNYYDDYDGDGWVDLRQRASWQCRVVDADDVVLFSQQGPGVESICRWDGDRFVTSGNPVITPSVVLTGSLDIYPQLAKIERDLVRLTDCSGDDR